MEEKRKNDKKQVFEEFLEEQQVRLKPRTYGGYEDAIYLFEQCLNSYAYQYLDSNNKRIEQSFIFSKAFIPL
nr:hypothetical protein BSM_10820 [uncultured archaeon]